MSKETPFYSEAADFQPSKERFNPEVTSQESLWRIDFILKRYSQGDLTHPREALRTDFQALAHEELLAQRKMSWSRELHDYGTTGGGYDDPLQRMTQNYVSYIGRENGDISRAILENLMLKETETIAAETAEEPGTFMVWISPPGPVEQGYQGITSAQDWTAPEKFPSKIYIMWSEGAEMKTVQLTGWPNVDQLVSFWEKLNGKPFPHGDKENILLELIANLTVKKDFAGTPEEFVNQVSQDFFASQESWSNAVEMPSVNPEKFDQEVEKGWQEFYWPEVQKLLSVIPKDLTDNDPFWSSEEYRQVVQELDLAFAYYFRTLSLFVSQGDKAKMIPWPKVRKSFHFDCDVKVYGKKASVREMKNHTAVLRTFMDIGNKGFSVSQCGLLAPFPTALNAMKSAGNFNGVLGLNGNFKKEFSPAYAEKLQSEEYQLKLAEYQRIQTGNYQELTLTVNGEDVHYMVPADFLTGKGCFVAEVDGQEVAMGPCDIPLDTIFKDPNENLVYKMSALEFAEHARQLYNFLFADELETAANSIDKNPQLSQTEKQKAKQLLAELETIIFKPTIGLSELVAGVTPFNEDAGLYLPGQITQQLHQSKNPIKLLEEMVFSTSVFSSS